MTTFTAETTSELTSPAFILKHNFSSNSGTSDSSIENIASRQRTFYAGDSLTISNSGNNISITTSLIPVEHPKSGSPSGIGITERFPLGTYIQVDDEIMRVASSTLEGTNKLTVLRGVFSSNLGIHSDTSLVKKLMQSLLSSVDHQLFVHLVTHLNILDMVQAITQQVCHKFKQEL